MPNPSFFHAFACISGATSVAFGAFGAHALKSKFTPHQQTSWSTATMYQLMHSIALLAIANQSSLTRPNQIASFAFSSGILLFSGSIYGLCLTKEGDSIRSFLGPATPLGGMSFIVGWIALAFARRGGGIRLN